MMNFHVSPHSLPVHLKSATTVGVDSPDETSINLSRKGRECRTTGPPGKGPGAQLCLSVLCENTHPGSSPEERAD